MNKKYLTIAIALVILAIIVVPVSAVLPDKSPLPSGKPYEFIWTFLQDLQKQITNIPAGAKGDTGPVGPIGPAGKDGTNGVNGKDGAQGPTGPAGAKVHFGPAQDINVQGQTTYYATAATDGIVMLRCRNLLGGMVLASGDTWDGTTNAGIIYESERSASSTSASITMPVASGESWSVNWRDCEANLYWRPLIS